MSVDPVSLAITAALTAVNMAVAASRTIEGPRLKDTSATVADYGTPLNYFVGQRVLPAPCFFAKPIVEKKKKRKGKSGKQVEYSGFATWAAHIADHEIAGVAKIWFDNHLVYNATGDEVELYPLGPDYELEANIRIYLGTEDQEPDPDMLAYIEARDGAGTCPAYRGTSYVYFENVPVEMLGNRFPTVTILARTVSPPEFEGVYMYFWLEALSITSSGGSIYYPHTPDWALTNETQSLSGSDDSDPGSTLWFERIIAPASAGGTFGGFYGYLTVDPGETSGDEWNLRLQFPSLGVYETPGGELNKCRLHFRPWYQSTWTTVTPYDSNVFDDDLQIYGNGSFDVESLWPDNWFFAFGAADAEGPGGYDAGPDTYATLEQLLDFVSERAGLDPADYDWSAAGEITFGGYNWTQGTGRQILEPMLDLYDVDVRPHDFGLEVLLRGGASLGAIETGSMVRTGQNGAPYALKDAAPGDLPRRFFLAYSDLTTDQNPNVAMPPAAPSREAAGTVRELTLDMKPLALFPDDAQQLAERFLRRVRVGRTTADFSVTRQMLSLEPGDVWTPYFDERGWSMRNTKLVIGADGVLGGEWERDMAALAVLSVTTPGAPAQGHVPDVVPSDIGTLGLVLDVPLLTDAHEQSAPLAYLAAGPAEPGVWTGADFAKSETGELDSYASAWDGIAAGDGSVIGECQDALPAGAVPWVLAEGGAVTVTLNAGELTSATVEELLLDQTLNLAAVRSGDGWELVQFMTATLTGELTYQVGGFIRGVRGTEWAMAGHQAGDEFVLLSDAKRHTMGAAEVADQDWYIAAPTGQTPNQAAAFAVLYTGASHKPLAAVNGTVEVVETSPGAGDLLFGATRRTRIGGATLDGQDVPLGETAESWSLDILDHSTSPPTVVRTLTGSALPLTYPEADQVTDFGAALNSLSPPAVVTGRLYQVSPPLSLRGYPLEIEVEL